MMVESFRNLIVGVDLSGSDKRPTGIACAENSFTRVVLSSIFSDTEILRVCEGACLVAMDSPLSLPTAGAMRDVDRLMISRGLRVFPPLFKGMRALTFRGIKLMRELQKKGIKVIEVHPRSTMRVLGCESREEFLSFIERAGVRIDGTINKHTIDALAAALTGFLYCVGCVEEVKAKDGVIVLPATMKWTPDLLKKLIFLSSE